MSQLSNKDFDSYILYESSLFVYPYKIILKTCGTMKLLLSIPRILELAEELSLSLLSAKYSYGTFIFPGAQPSPHRSFSEEVAILNQFFGGLNLCGKAYVIGDLVVPTISGIYIMPPGSLSCPWLILKCLTGLNTEQASIFFKNSVDGYSSSAKEMTKLARISDIIPEMEICDFKLDVRRDELDARRNLDIMTMESVPR